MAYIGTKDWYAEVAKGNITGHSIIHQFGQNEAVSTTLLPISRGGVFETPQVAGATTLRIKAGGNANDTALGTGAREVTFFGLDETGTLVSEAVATLGALASLATTITFMRLHEACVTASGTYATPAVAGGSHSAAIVIENGAGGTDWGTVEALVFPHSKTEIGSYSIPVGFTGYLLSGFGFSDTTKITEILITSRTGILQTAAPYDAMEVIYDERVEGGEFNMDIKAPVLIGTACDFIVMAKVDAGTAEVEFDFEILLIDNNFI